MSYQLCDYFFDEEKIRELRWIVFDEKIHEQIINQYVNNRIHLSCSGVKIFYVDFVFPYARYCFLTHIYSCTIQNITCGVAKEIRLVFKLLDLYFGWFVIFEICYELYAECNSIGVVAPRKYYNITMYMFLEDAHERFQLQDAEIEELFKYKI